MYRFVLNVTFFEIIFFYLLVFVFFLKFILSSVELTRSLSFSPDKTFFLEFVCFSL